MPVYTKIGLKNLIENKIKVESLGDRITSSDLREVLLAQNESYTFQDQITGLFDLVEDTTPQLGGNLDLNGYIINGLQIGVNVQAFSSILQNTTASFTTSLESKLSNIENFATADQVASEVPFAPIGNVAATDVQAAIVELDTEKGTLSANQTWSGVNTFSSWIIPDSYLFIGQTTGSSINTDHATFRLSDTNKWEFQKTNTAFFLSNDISAITETRTVTYPDANIDFGNFGGAFILNGSITGAKLDDFTITSIKYAASSVNNSVLTQMPPETIKGNNTLSSENPLDLTPTQVRALLNVEDGATSDQSALEIEIAYNSVVDIVSQVDAEAGVSTTVYRWTPERVAQAITALGTGGSSLPVVDTTAIIQGSVDNSKQIRFEVDNLTTATTRVLTVPDFDLTLVGLEQGQDFTAGATISFQADATTEGLRLRGVATDPSAPSIGGIWYRSDINKIRFRDNTQSLTLLDSSTGAQLATGNTYAAGATQSFQANATTAGLRLVGVAANPSTPTDGSIWFNTTTNRFNVAYSASTGSLALTSDLVNYITSSSTHTLSNKTIAFGSNTLTDVMSLTTAQSVTAGIKKTFQANATTAGFRLAGVTADPSTLVAGDIWYRSDTEKISYRGTSGARSLVTESLTQTLTNKTIDSATNTITLATSTVTTGTFADARISASSVTQHTTSTATTGTTISLTNNQGTFYNMSSANTATSYTTTGTTVGAFAVVLINAASQPTVTGATLIPGATFTASTNMHMVVQYFGATVQYYFLALS